MKQHSSTLLAMQKTLWTTFSSFRQPLLTAPFAPFSERKLSWMPKYSAGAACTLRTSDPLWKTAYWKSVNNPHLLRAWFLLHHRIASTRGRKEKVALVENADYPSTTTGWDNERGLFRKPSLRKSISDRANRWGSPNLISLIGHDRCSTLRLIQS
jgi:hypothetical protein